MGYIGKQCRPSADQTPHDAVSDQDLHCFGNSNFCLEPNKPKTLHLISLK